MNNLRKIRGKHEVSQAALAARIGVTKQAINYVEKNKGALSANMAVKIADALGENVFDILGTDAFRILPKTQEDITAIYKLLEEL